MSIKASTMEFKKTKVVKKSASKELSFNNFEKNVLSINNAPIVKKKKIIYK